MRIDILTLFPEMFQGPFEDSIVKRARERGLVEIHVHNFRDYGTGRHRQVDDAPYGGGAGMVLKPDPLFAAIEALLARSLGDAERPQPPGPDDPPVILMTPQGRQFSQAIAAELASHERLIFVCGHYEGVDERVREHAVSDQISIGDYVLTGGELPAMVVVDAVVRLIPGVLGGEGSATEESFVQGLLEYPHYTRPTTFRGWGLPDVLLSGHHAEIAKWRRRQAILRTLQRRPDLLARAELTRKEQEWLAQARREWAALPVASLPGQVYGIDFSGAEDAGRKIWLTHGVRVGERLRIDDCVRAETLPGSGRQREACLAALRAFIRSLGSSAVGLDFPFGLPRSLVDAPTWAEFVLAFGEKYPSPETFRAACFAQAGGRQLKRATDVESKTPFAPYFTWIYRQTFYGIRDLLAPLVRADEARVLPMQAAEAGKPWLLEICPASTLKREGFNRPYKGAARWEARRDILNELMRSNLMSLPDALSSRILDDAEGDALDSVIAALATFRALGVPGGLAVRSDGPEALEGYVYT